MPSAHPSSNPQFCAVEGSEHWQVPAMHVGLGHDCTAQYGGVSHSLLTHVGGHGGQSAFVVHCAAAHAPLEHAAGHGENELSHPQAPSSQTGLTNVTTDSAKQPGAGGLQSVALVHAWAGAEGGGG
jgi:hypothetical protein